MKNQVVNVYITKLDRRKQKFGLDETDKNDGWFKGYMFPNFCDGTLIEIVNGVFCYRGILSDSRWHGLMIAINEKDGVLYQIHACSYGKNKNDAAKRTSELWHLAWDNIDK